MTSADLAPIFGALFVLAILLALAILDARHHHRELIRLLNDLATMLGEMFDHDRKE